MSHIHILTLHRYYKTSTCVHETDTRGNCVKNGVHCAFAHGAHDMRKPECDVREIQNIDEEESGPGEGLVDWNVCLVTGCLYSHLYTIVTDQSETSV